MAEPKTGPTKASVEQFLQAATPPRRQEDALRLVEVFREVTGAEPTMWGPSIVGYGSYRYVSPSDRAGRVTGRKPGSRRARRH